jgi:tetratricopeptide (TPR) repeat protein
MHVTLKVGSSVFLSGPSGIGKTALASILATAYIASNPGGVLWFNVLEDDIKLLIAKVGRAYGVNALTANGEDWSNNAEIIRALLEKNHPLVVLDGLIDLDAAREFARSCAVKVPVIITNELAAAGPWTPMDLEALSEADSQALFRYYSGLQDNRYAPDIEGLSKFLGGNPLAIELAAKLITTDDKTPGELLTELPSTTGQDTQYMMMSVVFKRLPPPVQALLLVLAATPTGTATAEFIGDLSNVPAANIIPWMRQLVTRAVARELVIYGQFAYSLHESGQIYARRWLEQYQRLQMTENRALQAMLTYVKRHAHNTTTDQDRLAAEMDNILGMAAFATQTGQGDAVREFIRALTQDAGEFVTLRGFQPEIDQAKKLLSLLTSSAAAQTMAEATADTKPAEVTGPVETQPVAQTESRAEVSETTIAHEPAPAAQPETSPEPPADAQATPVVPRMPIKPPIPTRAEVDESLRKMRETPLPTSLEVTQPSSAPNEVLAALNPPEERTAKRKTSVWTPLDSLSDKPVAAEGVPLAERTEPEPEARISVADEPPVSPEDTETPTELSLPTLERRLADARAEDDKPQQAKVLHTLGQYYGDRGHPDQALDHYKQALTLYEEIEDNDGVLATLDALAAITAQADDVEGALVYATRGVNLAKQIGERERLGRLQTRLGDVRLVLGDLPAAIETYTQAVETLRGSEDWLQIGMVMAKLGNAYLEQGKPEEALKMLEPTLAIFRRERHTDYESRVLGTIGAAYGTLNQWTKAGQHHEQALKLARQASNRAEEAAQLAALGHVCEIQTDRGGAIQYYRQALHVAYLLDDLDLRAELAFELGRLLLDDTRTLIQAVQLLRESDSLVVNIEARRLLSRADKRVERTHSAGISLPPAEGTNRDYAAAAYAEAANVVSQPGAPPA